MALSIRKAKRSSAKPIICFHSTSGDGKTCTALLLARGYVGDKGKIVMIETEGGRSEGFTGETILSPKGIKQPIGNYDVISISGNFSSKIYGEAISLAEKSNYDALIIDSASHEWEGVGGVLAWAAKNEEEGKKGMLVWQKPKIEHNRLFMQRLFTTPIPLVIVTLRSRYPMEKQGNNWVRSLKLTPYQSENFLFEMFVQGHLDDEHRFQAKKYTVPSLIPVIPTGEVITLETGRNLAKWAAGNLKPESDLFAELKAKIEAGELEYAKDKIREAVDTKQGLNREQKDELVKDILDAEKETESSEPNEMADDLDAALNPDISNFLNLIKVAKTYAEMKSAIEGACKIAKPEEIEGVHRFFSARIEKIAVTGAEAIELDAAITKKINELTSPE